MVVIKQRNGLKRNTIDKFYTKQGVVEDCIKAIKEHLNISSSDLVIEPSAGDGAFIEGIKRLSNNYLFYDLDPEHNDIHKQDFLEVDTLDIRNKYEKIHIIGNPPFGRQSSMAIKFIKKCCLFSSSISFILPRSFKKDSMKKYFSSHYHLIHEVDLLKDSFLVNGVEYDVPCIFQIWEYKKEARIDAIKETALNFVFVKKEDTPDIAVRRVGFNAGRISLNVGDKNIQSHYFIRFTNTDTSTNSIDDNIQSLKGVKFSDSNTVGPKSISKQELIKEFNKALLS